jgi:hypothetical protein
MPMTASLIATPALASEGDPRVGDPRRVRLARDLHHREMLATPRRPRNPAAHQRRNDSMRKIITALSGLATVAFAAVMLRAGTAMAEEATLYKSPDCSCCENYADYLRENSFQVTVKPTHDLPVINREAGIPEELQGCHTMFIDGYAVSGHVLVATVRRLLDERPAIKGVTLPGMPMGSPGMSGMKTAPFTIYEIGEGNPRVYAVE